MDGIVSIMLISYYCGLGGYSHRLAYRLFIHPKFLDMLRLHSKTIFKLPAAFLLFLMLSAFVVVLNVATVSYIYDSKVCPVFFRNEYINLLVRETQLLSLTTLLRALTPARWRG
mgnify:CR=1 FL=1